MKRKKIKVGDVFSIALPNNKYAFGRLYKEGCIAFYEYFGETKEDIPKEETYRFIVGVYEDVLKSEWEKVGNKTFESEEEAWPPPMCMIDRLSGKYSIYHKGKIRPSTEEECEGLEVAAVWDSHHVVDRLMGDNSWNPR